MAGYGDTEVARLSKARDDFDSRNSERPLMQVSQFAWAPTGGNLVQSFAGSVQDYSDGRAPIQRQWEFTGGDWKPGGAARPALTEFQLHSARVRRDRWNTRPAAPAAPPRRIYSALPGSEPPSMQGGATSGTTAEMAAQMRKLYRQRLQTYEDTVVENGWGERPGEEAGAIGRQSNPATSPMLGIKLALAQMRSGVLPREPVPPPPPAVSRLTDALYSASTQQSAAGAIPILQSMFAQGIDGFASADVTTLKAWQETTRTISARYADNSEVATLAKTIEEFSRLQQAYAEHGMKRMNRITLGTAVRAALVKLSPETPEAATGALRDAATSAARRVSGSSAAAVDGATGSDDDENSDTESAVIGASDADSIDTDNIDGSSPVPPSGPPVPGTPATPAASASSFASFETPGGADAGRPSIGSTDTADPGSAARSPDHSRIQTIANSLTTNAISTLNSISFVLKGSYDLPGQLDIYDQMKDSLTSTRLLSLETELVKADKEGAAIGPFIELIDDMRAFKSKNSLIEPTGRPNVPYVRR